MEREVEMSYLMIPLDSQEQFETLLKPVGPTGKPADPFVIVYFTASWCGACSMLDFDRIRATRHDITWYKCDVDVNKYTLGYCGLSKIPSFVFIQSGKVLGKLTSSNTDLVVNTILDSFA